MRIREAADAEERIVYIPIHRLMDMTCGNRELNPQVF